MMSVKEDDENVVENDDVPQNISFGAFQLFQVEIERMRWGLRWMI